MKKGNMNYGTYPSDFNETTDKLSWFEYLLILILNSIKKLDIIQLKNGKSILENKKNVIVH